MPHQNRATPFGQIIATPERGTLMGNRGILHDHDGRIRRQWALRRWILCVLEFRGRHRIIMSPNRYTELFFLDEATGLAAGHRPCAECQRRRYREFRDAWSAGTLDRDPSSHLRWSDEIDAHLHAERLDPARSKRTFHASLGDLPDGVFVTRAGESDRACLILGDALLLWSPGGYRDRLPRENRERVCVLTPRSTVAAIRAGFTPRFHPSAGASPARALLDSSAGGNRLRDGQPEADKNQEMPAPNRLSAE
jgi:hypothetical protein